MTTERTAQGGSDAGRSDPGGRPKPAELDRLRRAVYARDATADAAVRYRAALGTVDEPHPGPRDRPPVRAAGRRGPLLALLLGGIVALAGTTAALSAVPQPRPSGTAAARVPFVPAAQAGRRVWTARGVGSLPSSPVLDGAGSPVVVALACRGRATIHLIVDQQDRRVRCTPDRVTRDSEYFTGHHGRFTLALSTSAPVDWVLTVTALDAG